MGSSRHFDRIRRSRQRFRLIGGTGAAGGGKKIRCAHYSPSRLARKHRSQDGGPARSPSIAPSTLSHTARRSRLQRVSDSSTPYSFFPKSHSPTGVCLLSRTSQSIKKHHHRLFFIHKPTLKVSHHSFREHSDDGGAALWILHLLMTCESRGVANEFRCALIHPVRAVKFARRARRGRIQ